MKYRTFLAASGVAAAILLSARAGAAKYAWGVFRARRRAASAHSRALERRLDETIEGTFPASDPPANTVGTGVRVGPTPYRGD